MTDPVSDAVDVRRARFGREPEGTDGVRECRISILDMREMGWISGTPERMLNELTCTVLGVSVGHPPGTAMDLPVTALRSDILVQRIPGNALDVVRMLS